MIGDLTAREVEVCAQIVKGLPHREIAANLGIKRATVKRHIGNIGLKLGLGYDSEHKILVTVFVAKHLMEAAQQYPLIAAALEL